MQGVQGIYKGRYVFKPGRGIFRAGGFLDCVSLTTRVPNWGVTYCTCGVPNQPELTALHGLYYGSVRCRPHWAYQPDRRVAYKSKKYPWLVAAYRFHNKVSGRAGCGVCVCVRVW